MTIDENGEIHMMQIRTPYNYDTDKVSRETALTCMEETKTQQQFKDETDINTIVERFGITGEMPEMREWPEQSEYLDVFNYQEAMNITVRARESFMELPANARARFHNDPQEFMNFMEDAGNVEEAAKLGLVIKRQTPPEIKPTENKGEEKEKE